MTSTENQSAPAAHFEVGTGPGVDADENDAAPPARFSEVGTGSGANAGENDAEGRTGPEADAGVNGNENQIVCDYTSFVRQLLSEDIMKKSL